MTIGFNNEQEDSPNFYDDRIGRPGHYSVGSIGATGILKEVNLEQRYISIQPSIVYGGNHAEVEREFPTTITIEHNIPISMRPLKEGDIERIAEEWNESRTPIKSETAEKE